MIPGIFTPPPLLRDTGASYIGKQTGFALSNVISTMGAASGDLLIVFDPQGSASVTLTSGGALTGMTSNLYYRSLDSSDVAGRVSASGGGASAFIYRGATSAALVVNDSGSGSAEDAGGFTKNAVHKGLVGLIFTSTASATLSFSAPPVFATRASFDAGVAAARTALWSDRLQPANVPYINSASIIWNTSAGATLRMVELR